MYQTITKCYNINFVITVCYWETPGNLYFTKKSDQKLKFYLCQNLADDLEYYHSLNLNLYSGQNYCVLGQYDSQNIGTTYSFYVSEKSLVETNFGATDNNLLRGYTIEIDANLILTDPPVIENIHQFSQNSVILNLAPPEHMLLDYTDFNFDYKIKYRRKMTEIDKIRLSMQNSTLKSQPIPWKTTFSKNSNSIKINHLNPDKIYEFQIFIKSSQNWGKMVF